MVIYRYNINNFCIQVFNFSNDFEYFSQTTARKPIVKHLIWLLFKAIKLTLLL